MNTSNTGAADSPFAEVRAAFEKLATPEKTAFIFEATVGTIAEAIEETSQRMGAWFEAMEDPKTAEDE